MTTTIQIQVNDTVINALRALIASFEAVNKICEMSDDELLDMTGMDRSVFSKMSDELLGHECTLRDIMGSSAVLIG